MRAISLSQPMAWAIFNGKDVENRSRPTKFRGRVQIHASKTFNQEHYNWIAQNENRLGCKLPQPEDFVHGALIGEVTIVGCVRGHGSRWAMNNQYQYALKDSKEYDKPIPCKGTIFPLFFEPNLLDVKR